MRDHHHLIVWQRADAAAAEIYRVTSDFPPAERFTLAAQMRRAAVSVVSNIAEGSARRSDREFSRHLDIAIGSIAELQAQVHLARSIHLLEADDTRIDDVLIEVRKMLTALDRQVRRRLG